MNIRFEHQSGFLLFWSGLWPSWRTQIKSRKRRNQDFCFLHPFLQLKRKTNCANSFLFIYIFTIDFPVPGIEHALDGDLEHGAHVYKKTGVLLNKISKLQLCNLSKCLKQIKLPISHHTWESISKFPSNISTIVLTNIRSEKMWTYIYFNI